MKRNTANFCPACGALALAAVDAKEFNCSDCGYRYFQNVAAAVAGVIQCRDEVLFAVRGREPAKGLLDFPGGFVDPDETLEQALLRELQEELAWRPSAPLRYLFSGFNSYLYAGVLYKTVDTFFHIEVADKPVFAVADDVDAVVWHKLDQLDPAALGFDVMRDAVKKLTQILVLA